MRVGSSGLALIAAAAFATGGSASPPPRGGTIAIRLTTDQGNDDASMRPFVDAVGAAFTARGFTVFDDPGHAASVLDLIVNRSDVGTGMTKARGGEGISPIGTGVSIPLSNGASQIVPLRRTRMEMRIHTRGGAGVVWDGVAVTVRAAGSPQGADGAVATDLSRALLRSYPVQPKDVVGVP